MESGRTQRRLGPWKAQLIPVAGKGLRASSAMEEKDGPITRTAWATMMNQDNNLRLLEPYGGSHNLANTSDN